MRAMKIAGIGEINVKHAIAFVVERLWGIGGKSETAGSDGSEEAFEIVELLVVGDELEYLAYVFAFYQMF